MENPNNSAPCYLTGQYFHEPGIDLTILQIAFIMTALLILASNGMLLRKLLPKKKKTRPDKLFIILAISDIGVGAITVPLISLFAFSLNEDIICSLYKTIAFFAYYPFVFSWTMVIIIAIDRCLMVTKSDTYGKYVTIKVLYGFIGFIFVIYTCIFGAVIPEGELAVNSSKVSPIHIIQIVLELLFMFTIAALYSYLLCYVRRKAKKFANNRSIHGQLSYGDKLTKSIFLIYLCLIIFTLPQIAGLLSWLLDPTAMPSETTVRNKSCWLLLALYSNSYANAMILLYRSKKRRNISWRYDQSKTNHRQ